VDNYDLSDTNYSQFAKLFNLISGNMGIGDGFLPESD